VENMLDYRKDKLALRTAKVKIMTAGLVFGVIFVIFSSYLAKQYIGKPEEQRLSNLKQIVELGRNSIEPILVKYRSKQISKAKALEQVRNLVRGMVYEDELGKNVPRPDERKLGQLPYIAVVRIFSVTPTI